MPWEHCGQSVPDDSGCPTCGLTKEQWSIKFDATRTFRLSRKPGAMLNLELVDVEGEPVPQEGYRAVLPDGQEITNATDAEGRSTMSCAAGKYVVAFPNIDRSQLVPPDGAEEAEAGGFRCPTGRKQKFQLSGIFLDFDVEAEDEWMEVEGIPYLLRKPDGERSGTLDETRRVRVFCPPDWIDKQVSLELFSGGEAVVEFEVQAEDGAFEVVGVPYTLTLHDGTTRTGKVDETRVVRVVTKPGEETGISLVLHLDGEVPPPPGPLKVTSFTVRAADGGAAGAEATVEQGGKVVLAWATTGAQKVTIVQRVEGGKRFVVLEDAPASGEHELVPDPPAQAYGIEASAGDTVELGDDVRVTVGVPDQPFIADFQGEEADPEAKDGRIRFTWKIVGKFSLVRLLPYFHDATKDTGSGGEGVKTLLMAGVAREQVYTLCVYDDAGALADHATIDLKLPPPPPRRRPAPKPKDPDPDPAAPNKLDLEDSDIELIDVDGKNEAPGSFGIDWRSLKFEKEIKFSKAVLPKDWIEEWGKADFKYATVEGTIELSFEGKLYTFPGKEGHTTQADIERAAAGFKTKLLDFTAKAPTGKFDPVKLEAKPKAPKPAGRSEGGITPTRWDVAFEFELSLGEFQKYSAELAVVKWEKAEAAEGHWNPIITPEIGVVELSHTTNFMALECKVKNDRGTVVGVVKGNLGITPKMTIKPNWKRIAVEIMGKELQGHIAGLALDISKEEILIAVVSNPELLLAGIPFVIVFEFVKAEQDWADVRKLYKTWDELRQNYRRGAMDGLLTIVSPSAPTSDPGYQQGKSHGEGCLKRIVESYKKRFLADDTNKRWAAKQTTDKVDAVVKKIVLEKLIESSVPETLTFDLEQRMLPGWRHSLYYKFRQAHLHSHHSVRDAVFQTLYRGCFPIDNYQAGYNAKLIPDDVFFVSAHPDAWYNHPPRHGTFRPRATLPEREGVGADPAPTPGQPLHSPRRLAGKPRPNGPGNPEGGLDGGEEDAVLARWRTKYGVTVFKRYPTKLAAAQDLIKLKKWRERDPAKGPSLGSGDLLLGGFEAAEEVFGPVGVNFDAVEPICLVGGKSGDVIALHVPKPSTILAMI